MRQKLTDLAVRNARPNGVKARKLADANGLYLHVDPNGSKYWRFRYRAADGRERVMALGIYPVVTLGAAREAHLDARRQLAGGIDPVQKRRSERREAQTAAAATFESRARLWHQKRLGKWTPSNATRILRRMEMHLFPKLGAIAVEKLTAREVLDVLRAIEASGSFETAKRCLQYTEGVLRLCLLDELVKAVVTDAIGRDALTSPANRNHSRVSPDELGELLRAVDRANLRPVTRLALALVFTTGVRTTEARAARWTEFDLDGGRWTIPAERMKMAAAHIVPLSRQAVDLLRELQQHTADNQYLFPNQARPTTFMSENAMLYAMNRAGYAGRQTVHGIRGLFSTIANESGKWDADVIELCLAHQSGNTVRRAYNSAQRLGDRARLLQWWADHLDQARSQVGAISNTVTKETTTTA